MRWALSMVTTRRCSVISFTVCVFGRSTSIPDCRMGAVIMKMISSTSTTSMNGTMLMSERLVCVALASCGISGKGFFDLRGEFQGEGVQTLRQIANVLQEMVISDKGGDGREKAGGGGDKRFGDAGSDGAEARSARRAEAGEGINDAPNGAKQSDERSNARRSGKPGHSFFDAANFFRRSELHGHGD